MRSVGQHPRVRASVDARARLGVGAHCSKRVAGARAVCVSSPSMAPSKVRFTRTRSRAYGAFGRATRRRTDVAAFSASARAVARAGSARAFEARPRAWVRARACVARATDAVYFFFALRAM